MDKILVDTSAWIEFFRKREPVYSTVSKLMDEKRVCCLGIVLAELIQGAKSEKELEVLRDFIHVFEFLPEATENWKKAGETSRELRRKGKTVGLSDCYIAVVAAVHAIKIMTFDRHFAAFKGTTGFSLFDI